MLLIAHILRVADVLVTMCQCFMPPLHSGNDEESASREILIQPFTAMFRSISLGAAEQRVVPGPACSVVAAPLSVKWKMLRRSAAVTTTISSGDGDA